MFTVLFVPCLHFLPECGTFSLHPEMGMYSFIRQFGIPMSVNMVHTVHACIVVSRTYVQYIHVSWLVATSKRPTGIHILLLPQCHECSQCRCVFHKQSLVFCSYSESSLSDCPVFRDSRIAQLSVHLTL